MSYVLGFFAADGNLIGNERGAHYFAVEICDYDILEKIRVVMNSAHKIGVRKRMNNQNNISFRLQIGSKEIYSDLCALGFSNNKTSNMSVPQVPDSLFSHFVRGYFDGDGHVWTGLLHKERVKPVSAIQTVFTSGSAVFLQDLMKRLGRLGIQGRLRKEKGYFRLTYSILSSLRLYLLMYKKLKSTLYLKRKKVIFDNYIKERNAVVAQR